MEYGGAAGETILQRHAFFRHYQRKTIQEFQGKEVIMENWLVIAVAVYLIGMVLYGHYKGFIKLAVSAVALVITFAAIHVAMPQVTNFLKNNTKIYSTFEESIKDAMKLNMEDNVTDPSGQRTIIEGLELPKQLKEALLENNNNEVYSVLGVDTFTQYIASYLANSIINIIGFLILFVVVFAALNIITVWLDLVARLPILSGINKIAGGILGGIEGLIFLWVICLFITAFSGTAGGKTLIHQIESNMFLSYIYDHNLLSSFVMTVVKTLL